MTIACLGWGSLIWNPGGLLIQNKWFEDGPLLPIEFTRRSDNQRMTLIIDDAAKPVRVLWALMTVDNLDEAIKSLKEREGTKEDAIHFIKSIDEPAKKTEIIIRKWLESKNLDAAVWTGLSYSKHTNNRRPSVIEVVNHLNGLEYNRRKVAEEYIRKAPRQIDTDYRRQIEIELGWLPID
ncbi:hypothetical protein ACFQ4C_30015 [Larkinella insperata]|uniref:Uncharacterized protein n=1 Tax=Larkinella insperata TaxID=332158 RepID=A0ABW3QNZ3_9BACT